MSYRYDIHNRLTEYRTEGVEETYTYDAEGVRRSKTSGEDTVCFISDTTGSLSQTLAETDAEGSLRAAYTRADTLISQTRENKSSLYLFNGHGDVRMLLTDTGMPSDTYSYHACVLHFHIGKTGHIPIILQCNNYQYVEDDPKMFF